MGIFATGGVIQGKDGNFYGTTYEGGTYGFGMIYKITSEGQETILHSFNRNTVDGAFPYAGVIQAKDGNFYGTTTDGGASLNGTVYKITPSGVLTILYSFTGTNGDGAFPYADVIQAKDGNFYGTTYDGGLYGLGTVYKVTPTGQETVLHAFTGSNINGDGANPYASVLQARDGNFYGTTSEGGTIGYGTVYKMTPTGQETVLCPFAGIYNGFEGSPTGGDPRSGLIQDKNGYLYGTTENGGYGANYDRLSGYGTIYRIIL